MLCKDRYPFLFYKACLISCLYTFLKNVINRNVYTSWKALSIFNTLYDSNHWQSVAMGWTFISFAWWFSWILLADKINSGFSWLLWCVWLGPAWNSWWFCMFCCLDSKLDSWISWEFARPKWTRLVWTRPEWMRLGLGAVSKKW